MKVHNRTSGPVIAFGWHHERGLGEDVTIGPNENKEVSGPYVGEMDGEKCYVHILGEIHCHEKPDDVDQHLFQVLPGQPMHLRLKGSDSGITVRHHADPRPAS